MEGINAYGLIYSITHKDSGKCYIGQHIGTDEKKRWVQHTHSSSGCTYIRNAIQFHGKENFDFKVITYSSGGQWLLDLLEIHYIADYKTLAPNGYNLKIGGMGGPLHEDTKRKIGLANSGEKSAMWGKTPSDETKKKISDANSGENNPFYGKSHTDEIKDMLRTKKIGENYGVVGKDHPWYGKKGKECSNYGLKRTTETRSKISKAKSGEKNYMYGKKHTDETKSRMSEAQKGEKGYWYGKISGFENPNAYIGLKALRFLDLENKKHAPKYSGFNTNSYIGLRSMRLFNLPPIRKCDALSGFNNPNSYIGLRAFLYMAKSL